jgi:hypothetical protein
VHQQIAAAVARITNQNGTNYGGGNGGSGVVIITEFVNL